MTEFTLTRQIQAPVQKVWEVLDKFGDIAQWSPGVKHSELTSDGPVGKGSTRHCDFAPLGSVNERIDGFVVNEHMTVALYDTSKLPFSQATAEFDLVPQDGGTALTLRYEYVPNRLGKMAKGTTEKQMRKGIGGLADALLDESERIAVL